MTGFVVTKFQEVTEGTLIPTDELFALREFLHTELQLCEDALRVPGAGEAHRRVTAASGRTYTVGDDWAATECEFCTHYAARFLAKYEVKERA